MKITETGHVELAIGMFTEEFWLAWGTNTAGSLEGVNEDTTLSELNEEVGRTKNTYRVYVYPNEGGAIEIGGAAWSPMPDKTGEPGVQEASKYIYMKFTFAQENNSTNVTIRQLGLFTNFDPTEVGAEYVDTSPGATYEVDRGAGSLFEIMNVSDIERDDVTSESYDIILTF